ncbi:hypothetical protein [Pedobacter psychrotolerans]|nr:hypothetical protein [Pedobacter psychrotolerans]GGE55516.1 hypothetical protein GCM10011413_22340 [Pedobacter psychrotolerans]
MKKNLIICVIVITLITSFTDSKAGSFIENAYREFKKKENASWNFTKLNFPGRVMNLTEGNFYERIYFTGAIYWFVGGKFHHVVSTDTYWGLFSHPEQYYSRIYTQNEFDVMDNLTGGKLGPDNGIISYNGALYFRMGNKIFYIHSQAEFDGYHLSYAVIQEVSSISNYINVQNGFGVNMIWPVN